MGPIVYCSKEKARLRLTFSRWSGGGGPLGDPPLPHGWRGMGALLIGMCCVGRLPRAPRTHRVRTASRNHLSQSVSSALLFTVFLSQCPAARDRRGTLAHSLPARTRESTPRLSPRLLTQPWLPRRPRRTRRTSFTRRGSDMHA